MRGYRYTSKLGKVPRQGTRGPIHHDLLLFHSSFGHEPSATHDLIEAKEYKEMHKTRSSDPLKMELLYDCRLHLASLSGAADDGGHLSLLYQCSYNRKLGRNLCKQLSEAQEKLKFELVVKVSPPDKSTSVVWQLQLPLSLRSEGHVISWWLECFPVQKLHISKGKNL